MVIKNQTYEIKITKQNINWFISRGYDCALKEIVLVKVEDLTPKNSRAIKIKCDYCNKEFSRRFADHTFIKSKTSIDKDACKDCALIKQREVFFLENGVENPFQLESVKDKIKESNMKLYGVENPMQSDEVKERLVIGYIEKYGVDNPSKSDVVKQRIVDTMQERYGVDNIMELAKYRLKIADSLSKNQSVSTSKQQIYIHKIYGGILNYANNCPVLDIAFPDLNMYTEYNGGGHDLKVKLGILSKEEFRQKELRRYHYLRGLGWKAMFIDSDNDLLPDDNKLLEILEIGKTYLLSGGKWIKFSIDDNMIICDTYKIDYAYGKLRSIKIKDVEEVS